MLYAERLIDPDAEPETEFDLVEVPFPPEGEAIPPDCFVLDCPLGDSLYGSEADAEREAASLIHRI